MPITIDYKAKVLEIIHILECDENGVIEPDRQWSSDEIGYIYQALRGTYKIRGRGKRKRIEQLPAKQVSVVGYLSEGGVLSGADADVENVAFEVFDCVDKAAEGLDSDQIQAEWEEVKKHYPYAIY